MQNPRIFPMFSSNPSKFFARPDEVVESEAFSRTQKEEILDHWISDERRLAESVAEGMDGGEPSRLRAATKALIHLREGAEPTAAKTEK